jgi:Uma2 family endonuclease
MSVAPTDYLTAVGHLPAGAVLRIDDVSWDDYQNLLADLGQGYAVRIFYDNGRMEVMAPASAHEKPKSVIHRLLTALSDELDIDIESLGSTTLRKEQKVVSAEPHDCFYIQNAAFVIGKDDLNLLNAPPPDLVVEIDRSSSSLDRFPIYAALDVPEVWRLARGKLMIHLLTGDSYADSLRSHAFPFLTAQVLSGYIALGLEEGERKAARAFREWVRDHHQSPG